MGEIGAIGKVARVIDGALCLSSAALCDLMGISPQTLSEWVLKGMPKVTRGWYPLKEIMAWRGQIKPDGFTGEIINLQQRKLAAEVALKEAQGELTRLKMDIANGKYIEREVITEEYRRFFVVLKRAMLAVPRRVAGMAAAYIDPVEARRLEKEAVESVTKALESFVKSGIIADE